ncbi:hypothetical protein [Nocardia sp. NPDC020380]|uniref:hypothetical protein n=1 Tax=Nocardia sp. NPDC020380 TaxID=3364309 RepID=UPI0037BC702A
MGQQPRSVVEVNVTVGPWVISSTRPASDRAEPGGIVNAWEPAAFGWYRDRDGDVWEKEERGWRLRLQAGVAVDPDTVWDWIAGHVRDYAPFTALG